MSNKAPMNPIIQDYIQRYKKNKLAANLALLGIVFCCAYFIVLYAQVRNDGYYYKWPIAVDVIYNLFFLLFVFLFSEQVKNYNRKLFWLQMIFGGMQFVRTMWLPLAGIAGNLTVYPSLAGVSFNPDNVPLTVGAFLCMVLFLSASGVCVILSGIFGFIRSKSLENFNKKIESGEVSIEKTLKELDEEDEKKASAVPATNVEEVTNA